MNKEELLKNIPNMDADNLLHYYGLFRIYENDSLLKGENHMVFKRLVYAFETEIKRRMR